MNKNELMSFVGRTKFWILGVGILYFLVYSVFPGVFQSCANPLEYSIGTIDVQHGISKSEVIALALKAEGIWEDALGYDMFSYNPESDFEINILYTDLQEDLDALDSYNVKVDQYNSDVLQYDEDLENYNQQVDYWNSQGGAPDSIYYALLHESRTLELQQSDLDDTYASLDIAESLLGESWLSENQGEYLFDYIDIFAFHDSDDLMVTLAHELGHHYMLDHSPHEESIMYYTEGVRPANMVITEYDKNTVLNQYQFCDPA